jgi:short-subunit dehydrogenase
MLKALITGANGGIGRALAQKLSQEGYFLFLTYRDDSNFLIFKEISSPKQIIKVDLTVPQDRLRIIQLIEEENFDLIINNAGFGLYGPLYLHDLKEEKNLVEVNVTALFEFTAHAIQTMIKKKRKGIIVNIASCAAFFSPFPYFASYSASKAFVLQLSKSLDAEVKKFGIRVLTSCPGPVASNFRLKASKFKNVENKNSMTCEFAAHEILKQIKKKTCVTIFNAPYRLFTVIARFMPSCLLERLVKKAIKKLESKT